MQNNSDRGDTLLSKDLLQMFELNPEKNGKTVQAFVYGLRNNERMALLLLSTTGRIIYNGVGADARNSAGMTMGVRVRADGSFEGDNVYGDFLTKVREAYRQELLEEGVRSISSGNAGIVVDYILPDEYRSHVELLEEEGERFIHTDVHARTFREFDVGLDGTTGHAARAGEEDIPWKTFVCPFGIDNRHKVKVGTLAEASLLYERGLRGEIDWEAQMAYFKRMGYVSNLSSADERDLVNDLRSQFAWMREKVMTDSSLRGMRIVAESLAIGDLSFGRTMYDPVYAPAPAHVLSYYIHNPLLLSVNAPALVVSALEEENKHEDYSFLLRRNDVGEISVLVDGTDIIGGRVPGTRSVAVNKPIVKRDRKGNMVYDADGQPVVLGYQSRRLELKSNEEVEQDFKKFTQRMDSILANIPSDVRVKFLCGTGYGVPQMLSRYVTMSGGRVSDWVFGSEYEDANGLPQYEKGHENVIREGGADSRLSLVRMRYMNRFAPVLLGGEKMVSCQMKVDNRYNDMMVSKEDGIGIDGCIVFTDKRDFFNDVYMRTASLASSSGLGVICVPQNTTESEQRNLALSEHLPVKDSLVGMNNYDSSLFAGDRRTEWDLKGEGSYVLRNAAFYVYSVSAYVGGRPYSSLMGLYAAMVLREHGVSDDGAYAGVSLLENMPYDDTLYDRYMAHISSFAGEVSPEMEEYCMRNAVHILAQSSVVFSRELLASGDADILCVDSGARGRLFVSDRGVGENRLGVILASERTAIRDEMERMRLEAEKVDREIALENERQKRISETHRADAVMLTGGLPKELPQGYDAMWLVGASDVERLKFRDDSRSFVQWEVTGKGDELNRELASRDMIDPGDGKFIRNNLVFLYPSNRRALAGRYNITNRPDSRELLGVTRENPETGRMFTCAFGIAVKKDAFRNEVDNPDGYASSFLSSRDSGMLNDSIVSADSRARSVAIENGQMLCYAVRDFRRRDGQESDYLTYNFQKELYDYPVTKTEVNPTTGAIVTEPGKRIPVKGTENSARPVFRKQYIPNPHASSELMACMRRYQDILKRGEKYPLNCFLLPKDDYSHVEENVFMADFNIVLRLMNAAAIERDVPMKFPLDRDGHLDLGEGVPKKYCIAAENRLKYFTNSLERRESMQGPLPLIKKAMISDYLKMNAALRGDGSDIYIRPSDLYRAFGRFDFHEALHGSSVPLHEMAFVSEDGTYFRVTDPRLSGKFSAEQVARFSRFEIDEVCRFVILSTDPSKIPDFTRVLGSYIERANRLEIETRVISERDLVSEVDRIARERYDGMRDMQQGGYSDEEMEQLFVKWKESLSYRNWLTEYNEREFETWARENGLSVESVSQLDNDSMVMYDAHLRDADMKLFDEWSRISGYRADSPQQLPSGLQENFSNWKDERMEDLFHDWKRSMVSPEMLSARYRDSFDSFVEEFDRNSFMQYKAMNDIEEPGQVGFIRIFSSNSDSYADGEGEYSVRGTADAVNVANDFDGTADQTPYAGSVDAADGFEGYVQYRYRLPDGGMSDWRTVADRDVALKIALSQLNRDYRSDMQLDLSKKVMDAEIRSLAVSDARLHTFTVKDESPDVRKTSSSMRVEESERYNPSSVQQKSCGRFFITSYDYHDVPADAMHVRVSPDCPESVLGTIQAAFSLVYPKEGFVGTMSEKDYAAGYVGDVLEANREKILKLVEKLRAMGLEKGKDIYFCSGGRPGMFDVRYLLCNFLNANGVECRENPADRSLYRRGHIALSGDDTPVFTGGLENRSSSQGSGVVYTCSTGGYAVRTRENAGADDADYTFQFAVDFSTAGERCTAREAGDRLVSVAVPVRDGGIDMSDAAVRDTVSLIRSQLAQDFIDGVPFGVNLAGNGIYTLEREGIDQSQVDLFLVKVFSSLRREGMNVFQLRSGGQSGVDESAYVIGKILDIPVHIHAPSGWLYRNASDVDVSCSREQFISRIESKDIERITREAVSDDRRRGVGVSV